TDALEERRIGGVRAQGVTIESVVHERHSGRECDLSLERAEREHAGLVPPLDDDRLGPLSLRVRVAAEQAERERLSEARGALDVAGARSILERLVERFERCFGSALQYPVGAFLAPRHREQMVRVESFEAVPRVGQM